MNWPSSMCARHTSASAVHTGQDKVWGEVGPNPASISPEACKSGEEAQVLAERKYSLLATLPACAVD